MSRELNPSFFVPEAIMRSSLRILAASSAIAPLCRAAGHMLASLACLMSLSTFAGAQVSLGNTPFGSFQDGPIDRVNLGNLNVEMTFPIFSKQERGSTYSISLTYDTTVWKPQPITNNVLQTPYWVMAPNVGWTRNNPDHGNYLVDSYQYNLNCGAGGGWGIPFDGNIQDTYNGISAQQVEYEIDGVPADFAQFASEAATGYVQNLPSIDNSCQVNVQAAIYDGFSYVDYDNIPHPFGSAYLLSGWGFPYYLSGFPATATDGSGYILNATLSSSSPHLLFL